MKGSDKLFFLLATVALLSLSGCSLLNQAKSFDRFVHSTFTLENASFQKVGGVAMNNGNTLNFSQVMQITGKLLEKKLTTQVLLTIRVQNPTEGTAAVNGMDWVMVKDTTVLANGQLTKPVVVKSKQSTTFQVTALFNASKVLNLTNIQQVVEFFQNPNDTRILNEMGITFKVKPWYKLAGKTHKFPGYVPIKPAS
ncbi:MAG: hypothetical protein JXR71_04735 [Bacteroidales bacterium]|nr:hypothetical protein [Bacteroidales bacterium]